MRDSHTHCPHHSYSLKSNGHARASVTQHKHCSSPGFPVNVAQPLLWLPGPKARAAHLIPLYPPSSHHLDCSAFKVWHPRCSAPSKPPSLIRSPCFHSHPPITFPHNQSNLLFFKDVLICLFVGKARGEREKERGKYRHSERESSSCRFIPQFPPALCSHQTGLGQAQAKSQELWISQVDDKDKT